MAGAGGRAGAVSVGERQVNFCRTVSGLGDPDSLYY